ncbi:MAG: thioredoxin domain-containing protein [Bacteroidetes bacterium]|nr:thioredoxin domain-containing protein [Bacteroidota bacterium]MBU1577910.1 thioredoxin domain-containing protein [Bacteroidota bacterium]MBU2558723.1 thioredoxin domain-containing protein [Bacteroidota bacterium]
MKKRKPNALIHESSPYLLQHAYNPVNWHAWNNKTLTAAKEQNKMLLVSIGYSACHWCHVMEEESFENEAVAALMNQHFICVKIDREERPDVDQFFMEAVQLLSGRGGWPLNCFALPDGRPFWGGTYFRKEQWMDVLQQIASLFNQKDPALLEQAEQLTQGIKSNQFAPLSVHSETDNSLLIEIMAKKLATQLDWEEGGTQGAPKFPMPDLLNFQLLPENTSSKLYDHAILSLKKMACGGIYDQVGGGFARYSVDRRWHVPHFEKMLYDNAQLIGLYAQAWKSSQNSLFAEVVHQSIQFCERELLGPEGAFMASLDADSEGEEGKFYVWTTNEFVDAAATEATLMAEFFGLGDKALWEDNKNVLIQAFDAKSYAAKNGLSLEAFHEKKKNTLQNLLQYRSKRVRPATDDKRLLSWNALMIIGLVKAASIFDRDDWLKTAEKTAEFISTQMRQADGGLFRSWKNDEAKIAAFLDDYAFYIQALFELFQQTGKVTYAIQGHELIQYTLRHFLVESQQSFAYSDLNNTDLPVVSFENFDNVNPSSNAAMAHVLIKASMLFEKPEYSKLAEKMIQQQAPKMAEYPSSFSHWAQALLLLETQQLIVVVGENALQAAQLVRKQINTLTLVATDESRQLPAVASKPETSEQRFYLCDTDGCRPAFSAIEQVLKEV